MIEYLFKKIPHYRKINQSILYKYKHTSLFYNQYLFIKLIIDDTYMQSQYSQEPTLKYSLLHHSRTFFCFNNHIELLPKVVTVISNFQTELPVPEQFKTVLSGNSLVTTSVENKG